MAIFSVLGVFGCALGFILVAAAESHQPTRRREREMHGFKTAGSAQRFLSVHATIYNTFNVQRHLVSARTHRVFRATAMQTWHEAGAAA